MLKKLSNNLIDVFDSLKNALSQSDFSNKETETIIDRLKLAIKQENPPKIALIGQCGVGKSSTINALFNAGRPISHIEACTHIDTSEIKDCFEAYDTPNGTILVCDMPGLGESIEADRKNIELYKKILPEVDVAVWIIAAGDRQLALMQYALNMITIAMDDDCLSKVLFAVNKSDIMYPNNWNDKINMPSNDQEINLSGFAETVKKQIKAVVNNWDSKIIVYSALKAYGLQELLLEMLEHAPKKRRWIIDQYADVANFLDNVDPKVLEMINTMMSPKENKGSDMNECDF